MAPGFSVWRAGCNAKICSGSHTPKVAGEATNSIKLTINVDLIDVSGISRQLWKAERNPRRRGKHEAAPLRAPSLVTLYKNKRVHFIKRVSRVCVSASLAGGVSVAQAVCVCVCPPSGVCACVSQAMYAVVSYRWYIRLIRGTVVVGHEGVELQGVQFEAGVVDVLNVLHGILVHGQQGGRLAIHMNNEQ